MKIIQTFTVLFLCLSASWGFAGFDHSKWDALLKENVTAINNGHATTVNYDKISTHRNTLQAYLTSLSAVNRDEFDSWDVNEQLAFLINAYNSWTVELILTQYPDLDSIKNLGSFLQSPWKKEFIPLLGKTRSLDDIEHGLIRGSDRYQEPRIHFAVNCASIGCPALRNEAYTGAKLEGQLETAERSFLGDSSRNRYNSNNNTLEISYIFKWYGEDFSKGWNGINSLNTYLATNAPALQLNQKQAQDIAAKKIKIKYLKYNWDLNKTK